MNIKGHGVDIVETARIRRMLGSHPERFLNRVFTAGEQAYAQSRPKRSFEHLAGRFASKEAVLKVLGTGWSGGIAWTDVEVVREPSGQPRVRLTGVAAQKADELGITDWWLSISHTDTHAVASAIGAGG